MGGGEATPSEAVGGGVFTQTQTVHPLKTTAEKKTTREQEKQQAAASAPHVKDEAPKTWNTPLDRAWARQALRRKWLRREADALRAEVKKAKVEAFR